MQTFQILIKEIHKVNKAWHSFEIVNRFLDRENSYLEKHYLKKKNRLQEQLIKEYSDKIEILPPDESGFESIYIKKEFQFENYKDACHKIKENNG